MQVYGNGTAHRHEPSAASFSSSPEFAVDPTSIIGDKVNICLSVHAPVTRIMVRFGVALGVCSVSVLCVMYVCLQYSWHAQASISSRLHLGTSRRSHTLSGSSSASLEEKAHQKWPSQQPQPLRFRHARPPHSCSLHSGDLGRSRRLDPNLLPEQH